MAKLTEKQERFVREYIIDLNATAAYQRAGYVATGAAARANACRLLTNANVSERIAELQKESFERAAITADRVLEELAKLGFSNMLDYVNVGTNGDAYVDLRRMTRDQAAAVQEITVEDFVDQRGEDARDVRRVKFKLADKKSSLELLGKYLRLFTDRVEHTQIGEVEIVIGGGPENDGAGNPSDTEPDTP